MQSLSSVRRSLMCLWIFCLMMIAMSIVSGLSNLKVEASRQALHNSIQQLQQEGGGQ